MEKIDTERMYVPIQIKDDPLNKVIEIKGMKYSYSIFEFFADTFNVGKKFQYINGKNGIISIKVLEVDDGNERL